MAARLCEAAARDEAARDEAAGVGTVRDAVVGEVADSCKAASRAMWLVEALWVEPLVESSVADSRLVDLFRGLVVGWCRALEA